MSTTARETPDETSRHERMLERAREREEPTRTVTIRKRYKQRLRGRWDAIRAAVRKGVIENGAFALQRESLQREALVDAPRRNQFDFPSDRQKVEAFNRWLDQQTEREILQRFGRENDLIAKAYGRGIEDAQAELNALAIGDDSAAAATAARLPVHKQQLERLYARNFRALEGMTEATGREMSRVLTEGLAAGDGPRDIADGLADRIEHVGKHRANMIARTEIMNSHNAGRLQEWERAGVRQVGVLIAATACPTCQAYKAGEPYPASKAYGNLPQHPNCRCSHHVWTGDE